jgi:hypothetical protein
MGNVPDSSSFLRPRRVSCYIDCYRWQPLSHAQLPSRFPTTADSTENWLKPSCRRLDEGTGIMKRIGVATLLLILSVAVVCRADLQVQTLQPNRQDRFYAGDDKDFLGQVFDWSGVGQADNGAWATMISPDYFVSAAHYHPSGGDVLTFYEGNSLSGASHQFTVASWSYQTTLNGVPSDLWIGKLVTPISAEDHISYYPILGLHSNDDYVGRMIYVNGKSNRVGRNVIDQITTAQEPDLPAAPDRNTVTMEYDYDTVNGLGADECYLIGGDSGGPSFADADGRLALVGVHYYNGGTPGPIDIGLISGDSFVPYFIDQLNANMGGERVGVVPEPNTLVLLLVALLPVAWLELRRLRVKLN